MGIYFHHNSENGTGNYTINKDSLDSEFRPVENQMHSDNFRKSAKEVTKRYTGLQLI